MKLAKAKEYYELGLLKAFSAVAVHDEGEPPGWILSIAGKEGRAWTMHTALNEEKTYATLDSLNADVRRVLGAGAAAPCWTFNL